MAAEDWATYNTNARAKAGESAEIARQISEFEQRGGKIQRIERGVITAKERNMNEAASLVPEETRKRAMERSKLSKLATKSAKKAVERITPKNHAILLAIVSLESRGMKINQPAICKMGGLNIANIGPTMDTMIVKGLVQEVCKKIYAITDKGRAHVNA